MATATTTTATLNVVSLHGTGNYTGPACIILNTAGATLSQVQQQHQHLLVNPRNDTDYLQPHRLQQQQLSHHQQPLDRTNPHQNNNNNNFNINNIGTATNNGTVLGVVGVGELVGLVGVGPSVVNVPPCLTTTAATVTPTVLAPSDTSTTSTAALALRLNADPSVTIPAVLRSINAPAPITTNVTSSNVILNVSHVLNNHTTTTTTMTTSTTTATANNNNNNNITCKNYNINTNNNFASDKNNNGSHVDNNIKKLKMRTTCQNRLLGLHSHHLLPTIQQAYQQDPTQHQPELLRCKRRIDFSGLGFTLPRAQPAAVARRNERERNRVKLVNLGFEALREHVPSGRKNKKMSKVETLRAAVQYIKNLQEMLQHEPDFIDITDLEACAAVASAAAAHLTSSTCVAQSQMATSVTSKSISPPPNSDISCSPSSSLCSDSGSSCDPFNEDDLIDFSRLL